MSNYASLYSIEHLRITDILIVADILTDAFESNPCYALIFSSAAKRRAGLNWLFRANLYLLNKLHSSTYVVRAKNTGDIIGTFSLVHPDGVQTRFSDLLTIGVPGFILKFGIKSLYRMLRLDSLNKQTLNEAMKNTSYWYLSMVVIKREFRGTGVGSYAIQNLLQHFQCSHLNIPRIGLTTQLPENVTFYSKSGFQQINEGEIPFFESTYYNYTLKYELKNQK